MLFRVIRCNCTYISLPSANLYTSNYASTQAPNTLILRRSITTHTTAQLSRKSKEKPPGYTQSLVPVHMGQHSPTNPNRRANHNSLSTRQALEEWVNPPLSSLPPQLSLPEKDPSASKFKYYLSMGKAYLSFYKSGVKAVFTNRSAAQKIDDKVHDKGFTSAQGGVHGAARAGQLSRAQFRLLVRAKQDVTKIVPFFLMLCVFGEFTPLIVFAVGTSIVPGVCQIPAQVVGRRQAREARRRREFEAKELVRAGMQEKWRQHLLLAEEEEEGKKVGGDVGVAWWDVWAKEEKHFLGNALGLYSEKWNRIGAPPTFWMDFKARRWARDILTDDILLGMRDSVQALSDAELRIACEERGLDVVDVAEDKLRARLADWVSTSQTQGYGALLTRTSEQWQKGSVRSPVAKRSGVEKSKK